MLTFCSSATTKIDVAVAIEISRGHRSRDCRDIQCWPRLKCAIAISEQDCHGRGILLRNSDVQLPIPVEVPDGKCMGEGCSHSRSDVARRLKGPISVAGQNTRSE